MLSQQAPYSSAESAKKLCYDYVLYKKGRVGAIAGRLRCLRCTYLPKASTATGSFARDASPILSIRIAPVV